MIYSRTSFKLLCAVAALASLVLSNANILAGTINSDNLPSLSVSLEGSKWTYQNSTKVYAPADQSGGYDYSGDFNQAILASRARVKILDLDFNPDPFVLNNILVTNTTASTQIFSVTVGLPTTFAGPNLISGNITTSVIDGGNDGATISSVVGQPIYKAQIDFNTVATLQNHPFSVVTPGSSSASASFGPTLSAVPVLNNIGIVLTFQLTAGDTAAILSRFDVVVPEPTSLVLASLIGIAIYASRAGRKR
jgi:hypothetical protein